MATPVWCCCPTAGRAVVLSTRQMANIGSIQSRESSVLPALGKQLEEAESGITNMLNAIQMGIINASTKQRLDELEERKKDIELQIIQEEMKHPAVSREDVIYFVCRFRSLDTSKLDARRRLIDSFVNAVTIFDDYILITFNYKEGETRIDFADIESSDLQSVGGAEGTGGSAPDGTPGPTGGQESQEIPCDPGQSAPAERSIWILKILLV